MTSQLTHLVFIMFPDTTCSELKTWNKASVFFRLIHSLDIVQIVSCQMYYIIVRFRAFVRGFAQRQEMVDCITLSGVSHVLLLHKCKWGWSNIGTFFQRTPRNVDSWGNFLASIIAFYSLHVLHINVLISITSAHGRRAVQGVHGNLSNE